MTGARIRLARATLAALCGVAVFPISADAQSGEDPDTGSKGGVAFKVVLREYLEFRVGSLVTIRSNAGQVIITASEYGRDVRSNAQDGYNMMPAELTNAARGGLRAERPAKPPVIPTIRPEINRTGFTNICLYLEGTAPKCGDIRDLPGGVVYTAINP